LARADEGHQSESCWNAAMEMASTDAAVTPRWMRSRRPGGCHCHRRRRFILGLTIDAAAGTSAALGSIEDASSRGMTSMASSSAVVGGHVNSLPADGRDDPGGESLFMTFCSSRSSPSHLSAGLCDSGLGRSVKRSREKAAKSAHPFARPPLSCYDFSICFRRL